MVMEVVHEEDNMQCTNHPYMSSSSPGGICAFCLQEKLGNLVSSFPGPIFPSSPSFRSEQGGGATASAATLQACHRGSSRLPSVFKRSKSTTSNARGGMHFLNDSEDYNPDKRGFWSFLYLTKPKKTVKNCKDSDFTSGEKKKEDQFVAVDENDQINPDDHQAGFDRKVSRSRSVGCGSRRFSGDLFERISTGLGDCTLRRVESHREKKSNNGQDCTKERAIRCGGIFSNLMIASSSSNWAPSSTQDRDHVVGKSSAAITHGRSKSWGWALASPVRAFSGKRDSSSTNKKTTPNLSAIPSLLAMIAQNIYWVNKHLKDFGRFLFQKSVNSMFSLNLNIFKKDKNKTTIAEQLSTRNFGIYLVDILKLWFYYCPYSEQEAFRFIYIQAVVQLTI
ncbi:uncharacterized protein LOC111377426 [Olea europaea var. sylvestris]|uniref:uncharacterized protein LOC111377426 n=1 Tax=Olea europaea var. sylvestris TaxID=158386 RepID=UPI000C1CEB80|nr:uncharacterized protein LOC111377426 [Olea europaea var. sylvestris]